ncbi:MAG: FAD-dependent oxidoreductase [Bacilli bacterium]|nr:FAD-dependent oxidoreductase [Bacilli bacterium]
MHDILIVGGGPAGLIAAKTAAEKGLRVLVIETKRNFDKLTRACSQQFILDEDYEGEGIVPKEGELYFPKSDFSVPYTGKLVPILNKYYHSPCGNVLRFARDNGKTPFSYKFDKEYMLKELYEVCLSLGVEFLLGATALDGKDYEDHVEVNVRGIDGPLVVSGKKLIIAEGVNAALCGKMGLNEKRPMVAKALVVKFYMKGIKDIEPNSWNLYYGNAFKSNAAIIIGPSLMGDEYNEITITGSASKKPQDIYDALVADSPLSAQLKDAELLFKTGCGVSAFPSMRTPYKGNVIAIGDASAFVEVEVQGAMLCGYHAANAIEKELRGEKGFEEYTEWWLKNFEFNKGQDVSVSQGYALVPFYTDEEIDYLFGLTSGECFYGTYSQYKTPELMWDGILNHAGQIMKEKPAIAEKMHHLFNMSLDTAIN